ncbi:MAG: TetR/AcrR family transcriptional regulator [Actinomycetota bacterium]
MQDMPQVSPKQRLLDAADLLMYQRGFEAVGVADLCSTADVRKGSFYHFFESKQQLAIDMLDQSWERTKTTLFASSVTDQSLSALDALDTYGRLLAENLERVSPGDDAVLGCRFGNFAVELSARDQIVRDKVAAIFAEMSHLIAETIERGVERGELHSGIDPNEAATDLVAHMEGLMVLAKARRDPSLLLRLGPTARRLLT